MEMDKFLDRLYEHLSDDDKSLFNKSISNDDFVNMVGLSTMKMATMVSLGFVDAQEFVSIHKEIQAGSPHLHWFQNNNGGAFGNDFEKYIISISQNIKKASKDLDHEYQRLSYDCWLDGIKIEVKAGRVQEPNMGKNSTFIERAAFSYSDSHKGCKFGQIKPYLSNVFIFGIIFKDEIRIAVIPSSVVTEIPGYTNTHHRDSNDGSCDYKRSNESFYKQYLTTPDNIEQAIRSAALHQ